VTQQGNNRQEVCCVDDNQRVYTPKQVSIHRMRLFRLLLGAAVLLPCGSAAANIDNADRIKPYTKHPCYWQYKGRPVLLLGGSKDDNLFQIPDLEEHLDEIERAGGNFIRNTMSDRLDKGFEVHAFKKLPNGKYDLNQWNDEYWRRFQNLLKWTHERDIVVQIEVWDRFDHSQAQWRDSPWRPANNVNYAGDESGLANEYPAPAWRDRQPFFHTVPGMDRYKKRYDLVRSFQERFVAKMLSYSLRYGNVLYCMNNETSTPPRWGLYWMRFILGKAAQQGVRVYVTDMFDDGWQPASSTKLRQALDNPAVYTFIDISQVNSRTFNQDHWDRFMWVVEERAKNPRPLNHTKIYSDGSTGWGSGTPVDGVERFWRNLIGGAAACRFHRPGAGIGLNDIAKACIGAARKLETEIKLWEVAPRLDLLGDRGVDEAYLAAKPGEKYVLYFTDGGSVQLDLNGYDGEFTLKWIDVSTGGWGAEYTFNAGTAVTVDAPKRGGWVAAIVRVQRGHTRHETVPLRRRAITSRVSTVSVTTK